jgi:hypothetical protein
MSEATQRVGVHVDIFCTSSDYCARLQAAILLTARDNP